MRKTYLDYRFLGGIMIFGMFVIAGPWLSIYLVSPEWNTFDIPTKITFILMIFCSLFLWYMFGNKLMPFLTVKKDEIVWWCPLYLPVKMKIEDCRYVGIADFAENNRGPFSGALISYIYLSDKPLSPEYLHKIDTVRCKKGFIKFAYDPALCKYLGEILPGQQGQIMRGYYSYMQATYFNPPARPNKSKGKKKKKK